MSQGKASGTSSSMPIASDTQKQYAADQAAMGKSVMGGLGSVLGSASDVYNSGAGGVNEAAGGVGQTGDMLAKNMGQGGAGAYNAGINALANISSPEYQQSQLNAAMIPAQLQYGQNMAAQNANFGGSGQIGSARAALASNQLAGQNQLMQQQAAAGVLNNLTNQQLQAGQGLTQAGISGGQLGLQGSQARLGAAQAPMGYLQQLANLYGSVGNMQQSNPNFNGLYGTQGTTSEKKSGISF